jgi:tetratricopeptide (TPR) repeat protein
VFARLRLSRDLAAALREAQSAQQRGHPDEADALYRKALRLDPDHVPALYNRGLLLLRAGRFDEAETHFREAVARQPKFAEGHNAAGLAARMAGRPEAAIAHYERALAARSDYAEAENNWGAVLKALEQFEAAAGHYRNALALKPDYAEAENNLGAALRAMGRPEEAIAHLRRALALKPDLAEAHSNLGASLQLIDRHDEALACFDRAVALKPDLAEAHHGRGIALNTLGCLNAARPALETAVELDPRRAEFYGALAQSKRLDDGDKHRALLDELARDIDALSQREQIELHFALGKVNADLGRHQRAFGHFRSGNALKRRQVAYDEAATLAQFERIEVVFGAELIRARAGIGHPSPAPVFVFGMPRSGTTLVEQVLASHPRVHGGGERGDFAAAMAGRGGVDALDGATLRAIGGSYAETAAALAPAAARVTDKMPGNFRFAGLIHLALPNARLIHVSRNPIDTCLSCFTTLFGGDQPFSYDLGELGRYYRAYAKLMAHWRRVLPSGVMLEVQYEAVIDDLATQARRIIAHCGLEWDPACLDFHRTRRPVWTASAVQVRQPLYQTSVGRWLPYKDMLEPLFAALGADRPG